MKYGPFYNTVANYVPVDNTLTYSYLTSKDKPTDVTTAAFVYGFHENNLVLANNIRRGIEIPGGHIEAGETVEEAGIRELYEETGAIVKKVSPLIRSTIKTDIDYLEDYRYPLPIANMEFFYGYIDKLTDNIKEDEVLSPIIVPVIYIAPPMGEQYTDGEVIFDTDNMVIEEAEMFNEKMRNPSFSEPLLVACRHHFMIQRERYCKKFILKCMGKIDNVSKEELYDIISGFIKEYGDNAEILYYNAVGGYYGVGFINEDDGYRFLKDMELRNFFMNDAEQYEVKHD